ncbi:MAG: hypothetical protein K6G26_01605 [Lachnospiraceae bacterium]|nr:hypothetical protein [Lachnospiraceae bacterium]
MKKNEKKVSFIRGLGLGLISATLLCSIMPLKVSDEEIIRRAKKLGMVEATEQNENKIKNILDNGAAKGLVEGIQEEEKTEEPVQSEIPEETLIPEGSEMPAESAVPTATVTPTVRPTVRPTIRPTVTPKVRPTVAPTIRPTVRPTIRPTVAPTIRPTVKPTIAPTVTPTQTPVVTACPTIAPAENNAEASYATITIAVNTSADGVAKMLHSKGVIDDANAFVKYLIDKGYDSKICAGTHNVPMGADYDKVAQAIIL